MSTRWTASNSRPLQLQGNVQVLRELCRSLSGEEEPTGHRPRKEKLSGEDVCLEFGSLASAIGFNFLSAESVAIFRLQGRINDLMAAAVTFLMKFPVAELVCDEERAFAARHVVAYDDLSELAD